MQKLRTTYKTTSKQNITLWPLPKNKKKISWYIPSAPSSLGTMKPSTSETSAATIKINNVKSWAASQASARNDLGFLAGMMLEPNTSRRLSMSFVGTASPATNQPCNVKKLAECVSVGTGCMKGRILCSPSSRQMTRGGYLPKFRRGFSVFWMNASLRAPDEVLPGIWLTALPAAQSLLGFECTAREGKYTTTPIKVNWLDGVYSISITSIFYSNSWLFRCY